jgi:tetratricopeptide (TPR) repeat protein
MRARFLLVFLALPACSGTPPPEAWLLPSDFAELGAVSPQGAEILKQAELARRAGHVDEAIALYRRAAPELPARDVPRRLECLLQAERERHAEAVEACEAGTNARNTAAGRRAFVAALMAGKTPPTPTELARALSIADHLWNTSSGSPYGPAAMADIALQVGDESMLSLYLEQLRKTWPEHPETQRLERLLSARRPSPAFYLAWVLLGGLLLLSAAHALRRLSLRARARALGAAAALLLLAQSQTAAAQLSEWPIDEANPEASVPTLERMNANPLQAGYHLMDLSEKAESAQKAGRHASAVKYYRAIAKMVPDRSVAFGKLCEAYEALGEHSNAIQACSAATTKPGVRVEDYQRFSRLILQEPDGLTPREVDDLGAMAQHLRGQGDAAAIIGEKLVCELGFRLDDPKRLSECTAALARLAPNDPQTISYQWTLALLKGDTKRAQELIGRARELGVEPAVLTKMETVTRASAPFWRRPAAVLPLGLLTTVAIGGLCLALIRRRRTLVPEAVP